MFIAIIINLRCLQRWLSSSSGHLNWQLFNFFYSFIKRYVVPIFTAMSQIFFYDYETFFATALELSTPDFDEIFEKGHNSRPQKI